MSHLLLLMQQPSRRLWTPPYLLLLQASWKLDLALLGTIRILYQNFSCYNQTLIGLLSSLSLHHCLDMCSIHSHCQFTFWWLMQAGYVGEDVESILYKLLTVRTRFQCPIAFSLACPAQWPSMTVVPRVAHRDNPNYYCSQISVNISYTKTVFLKFHYSFS